jgi:hypothetical protein
VVTLFDTGQMREMVDCAWLVWPAPVSPESFYAHPETFRQRAAGCQHYKFGRNGDLVLTEQKHP